MSKRIISALLVAVMVVGMLPTVSFAAEAESCTHHTEHTADCGYAEAVAGADCTHVHDEDCGSDCTHEHDDTCGYVAAVAGADCTYECAICPVQAMMDALSTAVPTSEEEYAALEDAILAVDDAMAELTSEQAEQLDYANYVAATDALAAYAEEDYSAEVLGDTPVRLKDGSISLYDLFITYGGAGVSDTLSSFRYVGNGTTSGSYNVTSLGDSVTLANGTYKIQKKAFMSSSWKDTGNSITVQVYHVITASISGHDDGAIEVATSSGTTTLTDGQTMEVDYGTAVTFAAKQVDGYVAGAPSGVTSPVKASGTVSVEYKLPTDSTFTAGSISNATVAANGEDLPLTVEAGTTVAVVATASGDNKYVTAVTVSGSDDSSVSSTTTGKTVTVNVTANASAATTYTVNVTTADAIVLSGNTIDYNSANKTSYDVLEGYIENLVASVAGSTSFGDLTVTYYTGIDEVFGAGGYQSLSYSASTGLAHDFGEQTSETVRITDGTYTWTGTIYLEDQRPDAFTVNTDTKLTEVDVEDDDAIIAQAKLALENWKGGLTADSSLVSYSIGTKPAESGYVTVTVSVEDDTNTAYKPTTGKTVSVPVAVTNDPAIIIVTNDGNKGTVELTGTNGKITNSSYEDTLTLTVTPNSGYYVKAIAVNGVAQTVSYTTSGGIISIQYKVENNTEYTFVVEYGASITVNETNGAGDNAGKFVVPFNGYYSAADQEAALESAIFAVLVNSNTGVVVHDDSCTIEVYDSGFGEGWHELSYFSSYNAFATFDANSTRSVKLSWDATNMHPAYEKEFSVYFEESRTAPEISTQTITVTADTQDAFIAAVKTEVVKRLNNSGITADNVSVTLKSGSYTGAGNYTVIVKVTNEGSTWIAHTDTNAVEVPVTASVNTYTITWVDADGTLLETDTGVSYGTTPKFNGNTPTKASDNDYKYTFNGWDNDTTDETVSGIVTVAGNTTYTAVYTQTTHSYESVVTPPTCTEGGYTTHTCSVCGHSYIGSETAVVEHAAGSAVVENEVSADCENAGSYDSVVYCTVCGGELSRETKTIEASGHSYGAVSIENKVEATCTKDGSYDEVQTCSKCSGVKRNTVTVPTTGHIAGNAVVENKVDADCENDGSYDSVVYCTVCSKELSRDTVTVDALGHTEGEAVVENKVDADCENAGSYDNVVYCAVCDKELSRETVTVKALGHTEGETVVENNVDPDCKNAGSYDNVVYCTVCGEELSRETVTVDALGHTDGEAVVENEKAAGCGKDGTYDSVVYCSVCGEELSREEKVLSATGDHTEANAVVENNVAPDCENDGSYDKVVYCTVCGEELSRETVTVDALGHTEDEAVVENKVDADCENAGSYDNVVYCTVCGEELSRETVTVDALGHTEGEAVVENNVAPDCENAGSYDNVVYCTVCGEELSRETVTVDALGHTAKSTYVVENEIEATCTTDGSWDKVYYCTVCGGVASKETVTIPATGHTEKAPVTENVVEATCTEDGSYDTVKYCSVCNDELSRVTTTVSAKGHGNNGYTYTNNGENHDGVCNDCRTLVIDDADHNYTYNATNHKCICGDVEEFTITWVVKGVSPNKTETYEYGATPSYGSDPAEYISNYVKYTFTKWDATPAAVTGDVTYTAQYSAELLASNGTIKMNGYYEQNGALSNHAVFNTLKDDILAAAGLSGASADDYKVEIQVSSDYYDLDTILDWDKGLQRTAFYGAVTVPETGRKAIITQTAASIAKTVTINIDEARSSLSITADQTTAAVASKTEMTKADVIAALKEQTGIKITKTDAYGNETTINVSDSCLHWDADFAWPEDGATSTYEITVYVNLLANETYSNAPSVKLTLTVADTTEFYTITWDANGGAWTGEAPVTTVKEGEIPTEPAENPTRDGYSFAGWTPEIVAASGNTTYKADWAEDTIYTITFLVEGETYDKQNINVTKNPTAVVADPITGKAAPDKEYGIFKGWDTDIVGKTPSSDLTVNATWYEDTNDNNVLDTSEKITVIVDANGSVTINGTEVANGESIVYDSTQTVTVVATPASGYYVDVTVDNTTLPGTWKSTDVATGLGGIFTDDYRNVFTGTFEAEQGKSYTVTATNTKYTWSLPEGKDEITIWASGYLYSGWSISLDSVLTEIYGEGNYNAALYEGAVDEGWGSLSIKINESCNYKVTLKATDKYPAVSDNVTLTVQESRPSLTIDVENTEILIADAENDLTKEQVIEIVKEKANISIKATDPKTNTPANVDWDDNYLSWGLQVYSWPGDGGEDKVYTITVNPSVATIGNATYQAHEGVELTVTLSDTTPMYTITWDANGGKWTDDDATKTTSVGAGKTPAAPANPSRDYYTFAGWNPEIETVTDEATYIAVWKPIADADGDGVADEEDTFIVTWTYNGGAATMTQELAWGTNIIVPNGIPTTYTDGNVTYTLTGWTGLTDGAKVTADVKYVAEYTTATAWIVTFNSVGGSYVASQTIVVERDDVVTKPEDPTKDGYRFMGWYTDEEYTNAYTFGNTISADLTLYAKWIVDTNNNGVEDADETISVVINKVDEADKVTINGNNASSYVYDSTAADNTITIVATPVTEVKTELNADLENIVKTVSTTYVQSVVLSDGTVVAATETGTGCYGDTFAYTYTFTADGAQTVVVTFAEAGFDLNDERVMNYHDGMTGVTNEMVYDTVVDTPDYANNVEWSITYLAREAMSQTVQLSSLGLDSTILKILGYMGIEDFTFDLPELWLDVNVETEGKVEDSVDLNTAVATYLTTEKINGLWDAYKAAADENGGLVLGAEAGYNAVKGEIDAIYNSVYAAAMYHGAHNFGYNNTDSETVVEKIKVTYKCEAYYIETETTITLKDLRAPSYVMGSNIEVMYKDYLDEDLVDIIGVYVASDAEGTAKIDGATVSSLEINDPYTMEGKEVSDTAYEITFKFKGDETYKPSEATFTVTVTKAPAELDLPNVNVTYGTEYDPIAEATVTLGNKYGEKADITKSLIQFLIGLDIADLDVDADGVNGLEGQIQLILPADLQSKLDALFGLTGVDTSDGMDMSLSELQTYLQYIDDGSLGILTQALETIGGITENGDLTITIGGDYPTDIGAYLYGAVSTNGNYETAYDVGYIIIQPKTTQVYLDWNYTDSNGVFTWELLKHIDFEATAYDEETFEAENTTATEQTHEVFFGIDEEGNFVAVLDTVTGEDPVTGEDLGNGAFVEIAFIAEFGNEFYYAVPIVRPIVIVPNVATIKFDDLNDNNQFLREFNNEEQVVTAKVYDVNGVDITANGKLTITYTGLQTNTQTYETTEAAPIHAGAYLVTATYVSENANGDITAVGVNVGILVIEPTESTIEVGNAIIKHEDKTATSYNIAEYLDIKAGSTVEGLTPDTTVIIGSIATSGDFSENGWDAVSDNVNIDFPAWVDELLSAYAPSIYSGSMTPAEFNSKVTAKIPDIIAQIEAYLAENGTETDLAELEDALVNALAEIQTIVDQLPENVTLTFAETDTLTAQGIGAYVVVGVVTDSDHYPSVDAGILVIVPDVDLVYLDWNYKDENGIFTQELMASVDLGATAYDDEEFTVPYEDKEYVITYQFIGVDAYGNPIVTDDATTLTNGAYVEVAYIEFEVAGEMVISDMIARSMLIIPNVVDVEIVDANENGILYREFTNKAQAVEVNVTYEGDVITVDEANLTVTYTGVQTNGKTYSDTAAPKHAGVYNVTAVYVHRDENGEVIAVGADVATLVIGPTTSDIVVEDKIVIFTGEDVNIADELEIKATSDADANLVIDTTIITGSIASTGDFSENGWAAIEGVVNVDFPRWVDDLLEEYAPEIYDGVTAADFEAKMASVVAEIKAALAETSIDADLLESLTAALDEIQNIVSELPENTSLKFENTDELNVNAVGAYVVVGVVTDSDHYPSVDAGILVIVPDVDVIFLDWDYKDSNGIWTRELLKIEGILDASAYDDFACTVPYTDKEIEITYQFIGINADGDLVIYNSADELANGVYTELAYVMFEVAGEMVIGNLIARPIVVMANTVDVELVDANNNDLFLREFDNEQQVIDATATYQDETLVDTANGVNDGNLTITYVGVQTNGKTYNSTTAPKHAGTYSVVALYKGYDEDGNLTKIGADTGVLVITPTTSSINVAGQTVTYDGNAYGATVEAVSKADAELVIDTTVISGTAYPTVDGSINEVGVLDALFGNVNIDFPAWIDEILRPEVSAYADGVSVEWLVNFIDAHRNNLIAQIPMEELVALGVDETKLNEAIATLSAYVDELIEVVEALPDNVTLTFEDDKTYTEPGTYLYYGIVTDSDHVPTLQATDARTGLLVIEKKEMKFGAWHTVVPYDGEGHTVYVPNDEVSYPEAPTMDYMTMVVDREANTVNFILEADAEYILSSLEGILDIELPEDMDIADLRTALTEQGVDVNEFANALVELIDTILAGMEKPTDPEEYSKSTYRNLEQIKDILSDLPENGTITINGDLPKNVGAYEFYLLAYSEYYETQAASAVLFIEPIHVVIDDVASGKVYGATDPDLTGKVTYYSYEGLEIINSGEKGNYVTDYAFKDPTDNIDVEKVVITKLPEDIELTYQVTREEGEDVGTYELYINGSTIDSKNYVLEYVEDDVFTISAAELTITLDNQTKVYGEVDPELTYTVSGLVNGDTAEDLNIVVSREEGEDVGAYAITATAENANYNITVVGGELEITKADVTITVADATKVYGESDPEFTATVEGLKFNETLDIEFSRETGEDVGEYIIKASAEDENYDISVEFGKLTITKGMASIQINNQTKVYGDADPELTYTINGVDEATAEKLAKSIVLTRVAGENVGQYTITLDYEQSGNYNILVATGTLTITKAIASVDVNDAAKVYGETDPEFTAEVEGLKFNETLNITYTREAGEDAGEYVITAAASDDNYDITFATGTLTITKAIASVDVNDATKVYGETDPEFTAEVEGLKFNETLNITYTREAGEDAGEYVITAAASDDNYDITFATGTLTITKAIASVDVNDAAKVYGDADPAFTATVSGLIGEDTLDITFNRVAGENVGRYDITATAANNNYTIIFATGLLTITKADVTITVNDKTMGATDKEIPELTHTVTVTEPGAVATEELNVTLSVEPTKNDADQIIPGEYVITAKYTESDNWNVTVVNGTLTVTAGNYVCWSMQTGVHYTDLSDALDAVDDAAAETIQVLTNIDGEQYLIVAPGTTLDLNGFTVEAMFVVGLNGSNVVDNSDDKTGLLQSSNVALAAKNAQLSYWDNVSKGYRFITIDFGINGVSRSETNEDKVRYWFQPSIKELLLNGAEDNKIEVMVELSWMRMNDGKNQNLTITWLASELIKYAESTNPNYGLYVTVSGLTGLTNVKLHATIVSDTGVRIEADEKVHADYYSK